MIRPGCGRQTGLGLVCLLFLVTSSVGVVAADASSSHSGVAGADQSCGSEDYTPPDITEWNETYVDGLSEDSLADWTNGRIVPVGGGGDCSLAVTDGESATLTATPVNGTRGIVTGVLDLGSNGTLRLTAVEGNLSDGSEAAVNESGTQNGTATNATDIVFENRGPDYGTTIEVSAGTHSERLSLSTGRFFEFAVRQDNGTVRIAVWETDTIWDEEWDRRFENASLGGDWRLGLDGRAFLDNIAIGVDASSDTPDDESEATTGDGFDTEDGSDSEEDFFDPESPSSETGSEQESPGLLFWGVLLLVFGAFSVRFARPLSRFSEQADAIGSTTPASEVEPAEWKVFLTKLSGMVFVGLGLLFIGMGLL